MTAWQPSFATSEMAAQGQAHLIEHAETLPAEQAAEFLAAAAAHPWAEIREALGSDVSGPGELRPAHGLTWKRQQAQGGVRERLARLGNAFLAGGRVATVLLAGGQGTRLGHAGPKGTFCLGPDDDRTLFHMLCERLLRAGRRTGRSVPLFVLVSPMTDAATREAFAANDNYGLAADDVRFVLQGQLPAVDAEGRALLSAPGELAMAPDGHGGVWSALVRDGILDELAERGVDAITTFQVDNPLARPVDPVMLGWMIERKAQVVSKTVAKAAPDERVGVLAREVSGRHRIVEYSELPDEVPENVNQGSIAIHAFGVRFLRDLFASGYRLPLHRAFKKVPYIDASGTRVEPCEPNAYKLERFLFDVFPQAERLEMHEVKRAFEFAPVKNADGVDSPVTARLLVDTEVRRWHEAMGRELPASVALRPLDIDGAESFI